MRDYRYTFSAGETKDLRTGGDCVHVVSANAPVLIELDESGQTSRFKRESGATIKLGGPSRPGGFGSLRITSEVAQTIVICVGFGNSTISGAINGDVTAEFSTPDLLVPLDDVTIPAGESVQIAGASQNRKELRFTLDQNASFPIRFGPNSISATKGGLVYPGVSEYVNTSAAIFAHNTDPDNPVKVSLLSIEQA